MSSPPPSRQNLRTPTWRHFLLLTSVVLLPISASILIHNLSPWQQAEQLISIPPISGNDSHKLIFPERIGVLELLGPEDLIYDSKLKVMYTGCIDGMIKRVTVQDAVSDTVIKNLVSTGGRPLGLAFGKNKNLIVADGYKGLLNVSLKGRIKVLSTEAGGKAFKIADSVDIAKDGMIYFTDASYKYSFAEYILDILERNPYGRLMSYNPKTKVTKVLLKDLYFPNGVTMMPGENALIFCETSMARCRKYYVKGKKKGKVEKFVDSLPGLPDNIFYEKSAGLYWLALSMDIIQFANSTWGRCATFDTRFCSMEKDSSAHQMPRSGGILVLDSKGEIKTYYYNIELSLISSIYKLRNHVYVGSGTNPYLLRLDVSNNSATNSTLFAKF